MGKSQRPRWREIREVQRIVGECEELGDDPRAWRQRAAEGACALSGARVGLYGELDMKDPGSQPAVELGWDSAREAAILHEYWESGAIYRSAWFPRYVERFMPAGTALSEQLFDAAQWSRAPTVHRWLNAAGLGHHVLSIRPHPGRDAWFDHLCLFRAAADPPAGRRVRLLIMFLHDELIQRLGRTLVDANQPTLTQLSPRQRDVLDLLLGGQTDQQIADRLYLSRHTVVDYVREIRKHFGVGSRAELSAWFLQRYRGG